VVTVTMKLKRVYDQPAPEDGYRVLVDRLWPRGLSKESAHVDLWVRGVAPTTELRKWYGHEIAKWPEFRERYEKELSRHDELLDLIRDIEHHQETVTLLFGARDQEHNEAVVLAEVLRRHSAHAS
jgi:uncharacterized protein YeaO (DUF488 family)